MKLLVHKLFEQQVEKSPENIAVVFNDKSLTYRELNTRANQLASFLNRSNRPNALIGICIERSLEMVVAVLGVLKAGCAYIPLDPEYPEDRIAYMLTDSKATVLLTQENLHSKLSPLIKNTICLDKEWGLISKEPETNSSGENNIDDLAYVIYTSGSTGKPKGVQMPHGPLWNLLTWQLANTKILVEGKTLQFAPLSFDVSFQEMFSTWCSGGTLILIPDQLRLEMVMLIEFIQDKAIDRLFLPFIALQHMAEVSVNLKLIPKCLKEIITAGEQLQISRHIVLFFQALDHCLLCNQYGPTESHVVTAFTLKGPPDTWAKLPSIGTPIDNVDIHILNEDLTPVSKNQSGEMYIGGVGLARGYLNRPDLTDEKFIQDPFTPSQKQRLYRTGDLARYNLAGDIEYIGRIDNQVKIRGYRIELGEIEVALCSHKEINQAVVIAREDEPGDKKLVAYMVTKKDQEIEQIGLRNFLANHLPDYMMPSIFIQVQFLPKTPSGKIDRLSLPIPMQHRPKMDQAYKEASTKLEKIFSTLWCQLLKMDKVGVEDNFFHLGGNSLLALRFVVKLKAEQNIKLPVVKLFQYPKIVSLIDYLDQQKEENLTFFSKVYDRVLKLKTAKKDTQDVAIIGMSGQFPGADTIDAFWQNLSKGKESISFFSKSELDPAIGSKATEAANYIRARGILNRPDCFDAHFFGMTPREAEVMDPQHRKFLEVAWSALENSGYVPDNYDGLIGVYAGMANNTYFNENLSSNSNILDAVGRFSVMLANEKDYLSTRIAHKFNLTGPCASIYTACSTSLVAISHAVNSLVSYQCDMALSGGVTITVPVQSGYLYQDGGMFSSDGHTRSYDDKAQGTVFSDGVGVIVLKRLSDALKDNDSILAVIRGTAINNDGSDKASFTAPSVDGQASVIAMAHANANVNPKTISYVEGHGTATPVGDPIELEALSHAFRTGTVEKQFCALGSLKSNIGHLNAAAGVAGVIKTVLCLKHKKIVPSINFTEPNREIDFLNSPFYINTTLKDWDKNDYPRRAGVSSFGVGGTNAHIILEEFTPTKAPKKTRPWQQLLFSAKSLPALDRMTNNFSDFLKANPNLNIGDAAHTLQAGRKKFSHGKVIICKNTAHAIEILDKGMGKESLYYNQENQPSKIIFMFPGQGAQHVNMGLDLYQTEPLFKETVDHCSQILEPLLGVDLRKILYPEDGQFKIATQKLKETKITQPALFVVEYALATLWMEWGIQPDAMIGHSVGEYVAACLSKVFSLEDALTIIAQRACLLQSMPPGSMRAVHMTPDEIRPFLNDEVCLAACNTPKTCVVSGPSSAINDFDKTMQSQGVKTMTLHTSHAFHSKMMDPAIAPFIKVFDNIQLNDPQVPFISCLEGSWISTQNAKDPEYWAKQLRHTVQFTKGVQTLNEFKSKVMIEVGPGTTLSSAIKQHPDNEEYQTVISSLHHAKKDTSALACFLEALGKTWLLGCKINWEGFYKDETRKRIALPTYPFEQNRYWIDPLVPTPQTHESTPQPEDTLKEKISTTVWQQEQVSNMSSACAFTPSSSYVMDMVENQLKIMEKQLELIEADPANFIMPTSEI